MQESVSMHKSPTPVRHSRMNQEREEEEEKRETGKTEARRLMERKAKKKKKTHLRNQNKEYLGTARIGFTD